MVIPSVGPFVGDAPEDDFAATVQPQLNVAMGARIPGSVTSYRGHADRLC
jgi:hypothetical protein